VREFKIYHFGTLLGDTKSAQNCILQKLNELVENIEIYTRYTWWLGKSINANDHKPIMGVWGQSPQRGPGAEPLVRGAKPPEAESILVIGCPTEPANLAPLVKFSK